MDVLIAIVAKIVLFDLLEQIFEANSAKFIRTIKSGSDPYSFIWIGLSLERFPPDDWMLMMIIKLKSYY